MLRDTLLRPMDRPVADNSNVGTLFATGEDKSNHHAREMTFEQLCQELPGIDKHMFDSEDSNGAQKLTR